ncbi:putative porin [Pelomonas saccharophila]|uniref:Porin n=1 Tax=Roseateles saccharophilus TaxID=304 RepID=A0ABU1YJJ8_ROSSA|nr:porin [Roseateles saccharophilus]MDR7269037.1 putative porin [Roseateles saccharophilus]
MAERIPENKKVHLSSQETTLMKKATFAVAVLAASTSAAWAQSSVTLYGIVDAATRYTTNANPGVAQKQLIPGGMSQSRLGVNVTEDMGGGLKALVNMEHRLSSDTGAVAAAEFWRQAWVGLQSSDFGQIRLGRQYNILFDVYTSTFASFRYSPYIEAYKPEIGMAMAARQDNMVKYLVQVGNIYGEVQVSAGEGQSGAAASLPNKTIGGLVRYNDGKFGAGGAYLQATEQTGKKIKATVLGASYTDGPLYVHASWGENKFDRISDLITSPAAVADANGNFRVALTTRGSYTSGLLGASIFNNNSADIKTRTMYMVGATYQLTPQLNIGANAWISKQTHYGLALAPLALSTTANSTSKADFFAVVLDYAFSKRTDAYLEADYTRLDGQVRFLNAASKRGGAMVGLRHRF